MAENQTIHSFDATFSVGGELYTPEKYRDLYAAMSSGNFVSRGAGVSYPLLSAGAGVRSIVSTQFNRILEFNKETGIVKVESGLALGTLLKFLSSHGWWLPTIPGHPSITVGGCIAVNAHGKSQYHSGLFGDSVIGLELFHPKHGKLSCGSSELPFKLTMGGFGLTGHIISATIQSKKLAGHSITKTTIPCSDIFEAVEVMLREKDHFDHVYSWNNLNIRGSSFGAGYVYCEKFSAEKVSDLKEFNSLVAPPRKGTVDQLLSFMLKNQVSRLYSLKEKVAPRSQQLGILAGAFPINGKEIYHRFFGANGLLESQIIIPHSQFRPVIQKLSMAISESGQSMSLGSLKIFRGAQSYIHFLGDGICLALNAPNTAKARTLFQKIDEICLEHKCLPNIAKDSRVEQKVVAGTYEGYAQFKKEILEFDPQMMIQSALRTRLGL